MKHVKSQEQYDHVKVNEPKRHAIKKGHSSILAGLQRAVGWTEEKCLYLDSPIVGRQIVHSHEERTSHT